MGNGVVHSLQQNIWCWILGTLLHQCGLKCREDVFFGWGLSGGSKETGEGIIDSCFGRRSAEFFWWCLRWCQVLAVCRWGHWWLLGGDRVQCRNYIINVEDWWFLTVFEGLLEILQNCGVQVNWCSRSQGCFQEVQVIHDEFRIYTTQMPLDYITILNTCITVGQIQHLHLRYQFWYHWCHLRYHCTKKPARVVQYICWSLTTLIDEMSKMTLTGPFKGSGK